MNDRPGGAAALVTAAGADGAGKSTLTRLLSERLSTSGVPARLVDRWDIVGNPLYPAASCLRPAEHEARSCAARMSSIPRLMFLLWAAALALTDRESGFVGEILLVDGYWIKHAASEIVYGADRGWVEAVAAGLPRSDLVAYLRLSPEVAWQRKHGNVVPYECGMDISCRRSSFLAHQRAIQAVLDRWTEQHGWHIFDAEKPPSEQADQLAWMIRSREVYMS